MLMKKLSEEHYIIMNDSEINIGDIVAEKLLTGEYELFTIHTLNDIDKSTQKKITHSTQPLGFLNEYGFTTANLKPDWTNVEYLPLSEVKELLGVVDVEKVAVEWYNGQAKYDSSFIADPYSWKEGYNQALEDNKYRKYTNEDMLTIRNQLVAFLLIGDVTALDKIQAISKYTKWFDECVESLQPTEWEVEFVNDKLKLKS